MGSNQEELSGTSHSQSERQGFNTKAIGVTFFVFHLLPPPLAQWEFMYALHL